MAKKPDHLADFEADDAAGVLGKLLADEDSFDGRTLWRIASWGAGATAAVVVAVMANQSSLGFKREQVAAVDLARQAQQVQLFARETQSEARRLAAAIDTLNGDRDRLYARVTGLEQGLDSVTGAVARQGSAAASTPAASQPSPAVATVATAPATASTSDKSANAVTVEPSPAPASVAAKDGAKNETAKADYAKADRAKDTAKAEAAKAELAKVEPAKPEAAKPSPAIPLVAAQSMMAPPDPAASKLVEPGKAPGPVIVSPIPDVIAATPSASDTETDDDGAPKAALRRTEFGVDLGSRQFGERVAHAVARAVEIANQRAAGGAAADHRRAGECEGARHAASPGRRPAQRCRRCGADLRRHDREQATLRNRDLRRPAAVAEGRRARAHRRQATATPPRRRQAGGAVDEEVAKKPEAPPATTQATLSTFFNRKSTQ